MAINNGLHYHAPDAESFNGFTKLTVTPEELLSLPQEQFRIYGYTGLMQLESVYRKIAEYSPEFLLFTQARNELVFLPHPEFIGRPEEKPVPLVKLINSGNSEHYFYPGDKRFMGRMGQQLEILDLAMPYVSMRIWEQTGYFSRKEGRNGLHVEAELDFDYWLRINPVFAQNHPPVSRAKIIQDLEFLLGFIPRERPVILSYPEAGRAPIYSK